MPIKEQDGINAEQTEIILVEEEVKHRTPSSIPANVWISDDRHEVIVTSGNITFEPQHSFYTGVLTEKTDVDCALAAFQRGFNGYYKKNNN